MVVKPQDGFGDDLVAGAAAGLGKIAPPNRPPRALPFGSSWTVAKRHPAGTEFRAIVLVVEFWFERQRRVFDRRAAAVGSPATSVRGASCRVPRAVRAC